MFNFTVHYPIQQAAETLNLATLCTSPTRKYLISGQCFSAFVLARNDNTEAVVSDISQFVPKCKIVTDPEVPKSGCKCGSRSDEGFMCSKRIASQRCKEEAWIKIEPYSWIYPLDISLPSIASPCISCCTTFAAYHKCTVSINVVHIQEKGAVVTNDDEQEHVVFNDVNTFTVVHVPKLTTTTISGDQNIILLKVQNVAYCVQIIEGLDLFAHSLEDSASLQSVSAEHTSNSPELTLSPLNDVFPLKLLALEAHTLSVNVDLKHPTTSTSQIYNILAQVVWRPGNQKSIKEASNITWPMPSCVRLSSIEVRCPAFVITASPDCKQPIPTHTRFSMQYTVHNKLQDLNNLRFVWSPERAIMEKRAQQNPVYKKSITSILDSVICHQPVLEMGSCILDTSTTVHVDFTILAPGVYELGQHMKLNIQPSVRGSPSKGSLHNATPPGSPYSGQFHGLPPSLSTSQAGSNSTRTSPQKTPQAPVRVIPNCSSVDRSPEKLASLRSDSEGTICSVTSVGSTRSPLTPGPAPISRLQILKRNCQVLSVDPALVK